MRQRKSFERLEGVRPARLIVIAAEGRYTENIYFEAMKTAMCASDVHVEVLRRDTNESNPDNVLRQILNFQNVYELEDDDQLWIVVDRDRWPEQMLAAVAQHCAQGNHLFFCVSNPCFELWLLLHLEDIAGYSNDQLRLLAANKKTTKRSDTWSKNRLKTLMGSYHESDYDTSRLLPHVNKAVERAERLDVKPADRWPQTIGTRVYLLVKSIMGDQK